MAKRIKTTKREYVALATSDDFERARNHLRQRANSRIQCLDGGKVFRALKRGQHTIEIS